jgi:hypothetical protein
MKKQNTNREYNFPDADLYAQCIERLKYMRRDADLFANYAYFVARMDTFEQNCQLFAELPNDDELVGDQMDATQKKNEAREALKTAIRSVMLRVEAVYPDSSGKYRKFGTFKMNDMTDAQLLLCGRRVVRVANSLISILEEMGLKQTHLDKVKESAAQFENALNIQMDKIADRDISVEKRVEIGNKLYRELILTCNIGKDIWAEKDRIKYQNYVIYESNNEQKKLRKQKLKLNVEADNLTNKLETDKNKS